MTPAVAAPTPAAEPAPEPIDVQAMLLDMAEDAGQELNWRTSIVDLMKLVGMDSSLANRKELAQELGCPGDMGDSASMNIWLHKAVMTALAEKRRQGSGRHARLTSRTGRLRTRLPRFDAPPGAG